MLNAPKPTARRRCTGPCGRTTSSSSTGCCAPAPTSRRPTATASRRCYLAAINGNAAMIERLLKAGADRERRRHRRRDRADDRRARRSRRRRAKCCSTHGAEVDARESWRGQTALMWAAAQRPSRDGPRAARARRRRQRALERRASGSGRVTAEPREKWLPPGGLTPLLFAAREGCVECVPVLVELGADVNATDAGRHQPDRDRAHQRPLRRRRRAARRGRRPEPARRRRAARRSTPRSTSTRCRRRTGRRRR